MAAMVNMNSLLNGKDSRWLQLEVCREFQRNKCSRQDTECKFAHPPANVEVQNGKVTACYDSIKGRCNRDKPPCKYFHPPQHLKDQLLINGRNHLALKNALMQQMGIAPGQPVMPGQVPTVATNPYLTGIPANTYSPYFAPGHLVPTILGPDPSAVASQLGPVVSQAVPVAQQKIPRSDRLEVCREFMRSACKRAESECRFAHPQESVTTHEDGSVTVCMDAVKGRCARDPCRYFHPPLHLQAQIKAAQSRATAMDVKTVGSFYYENFAFSGMVPFKRPAGEKSGIPVYQPGATTYQQLMQLQQPFVPVSCEYQSQNPSATTAIPQPQTSTTANPIIANNTNNHSMINNNSFILNNLNHLKNNNKISQVNLNSVHNSMASNGMLSINNLNNSTVNVSSSANISDIAATKINNSNSSNGVVVINTNNNVYSLKNNNIGSNTSDSSLVSNLTNKSILDTVTSTSTATTQAQSSSINTLTPSFSSTPPTVSTTPTLSTTDTSLTNTVNVSGALSSLGSSIPGQMLLSTSNLTTGTQAVDGNGIDAFNETVLLENANTFPNKASSPNATIASDCTSTAATVNSSLPCSMTTSNPTTTSSMIMSTAFSAPSEPQLKLNLLKNEQANNNISTTLTASSSDVSFSAPATPSISYSTNSQSRLYTAPHSYANVIVSHHGYTPVSSVATSAVPIAYSTAPSAYNYASYPTQSYPNQSYQAQCYPTNSYYADAATIAKEVAQKNYANAVKMAAASNALSGKPLSAAISYTGLPLNKTYVAQTPGAAAVAFSHHHQQQQAVAAAAAQAAQVAGLRLSSHTVGNALGAPPVSTPSLLPRPPTGFLQASPMMRTQPMSMPAAAASNPYAAAAAAAAAANQQYLQQQQQHFFYPGMMAGYPYSIATSGVPGLGSASGMPGMPSQMQAAQMAQMNQAAAAAAAAQASVQGSAVVLNPYKKMKTS
ncbi:mucin-19 isoform X3 [Episyrphus balteatus]|uniref:mucin-19 isoform X3 n=1 Tax=Episyrphus balteatus TaxID=286459 RepID=UPI002484DEF1|nr:mucin-19 isoform X3 [Episyrphus balteatus]